MGIGGTIFNFIGAFLRWIYGSFFLSLFYKDKKKYSFKEYLYGPENPEEYDCFEEYGHAFANRIWGIIGAGIICYLIIKISYLFDILKIMFS